MPSRLSDIIKSDRMRPRGYEPGHDPGVGYGGTCLYPVSELNKATAIRFAAPHAHLLVNRLWSYRRGGSITTLLPFLGQMADRRAFEPMIFC
jgi:hypothetical protein